MQLTAYTDYTLRTLMGLGAVAPDKLTVGKLIEAYGISLHHLLKVVAGLASLGYVETLRGKAGGARLAKPPAEICIGTVVVSASRLSRAPRAAASRTRSTSAMASASEIGRDQELLT